MSNIDVGFDFSGFALDQFLPTYLKDNTFYVDYMNATADLWKDHVLPYIKALAEIRQTITYNEKEKQDLWALIKNANLLGYNFLSQYMTQDNYVKLVEFLAKFHETQGNNNLADFIGFIRNAGLYLERLWTAYGPGEFQTFVSDALTNNNTVLQFPGSTATGVYYPTSHFRLIYYLDQSGLLDSNILKELFYNLAPAHFVLESIVASILFANEPLYLDTKSTGVLTEAVLVDLALETLTYNNEDLTSNNQPLQVLVAV